MHLPPPPSCTWEDVEDLLIASAETDLYAGYTPLPTIAAFAGDEVVAFGVLRPFDDGGPVPPLVELLALLLPCEVDRIALLLPGRAWSLADPVPPVCEDGDLRARVAVLIHADGRQRPCVPHTRLLTVAASEDGRGSRLVAAGVDTTEVEAPVVDALRILLDGRAAVVADTDTAELIAQLGRVLLLGHELALSPQLTARLTLASAV